MIHKLIQRFSADAPPLYECRQCGTELDVHADSCPNFGSDEIARYEFEE